jgi:hypothetical protein
MNSRSRREAKGAKGVNPQTEQLYTDTRILRTAQWWPAPASADAENGEGTRTLMGEIHLAGELCPGFDTTDLKLEVYPFLLLIQGLIYLIHGTLCIAVYRERAPA